MYACQINNKEMEFIKFSFILGLCYSLKVTKTKDLNNMKD